MARIKGSKKTGGRKKGNLNKVTSRKEDIDKWINLGFYDKADNAIKEALDSKDKKLDISKWLYEQKNGKAPQTHDIQGSITFDWATVARKVCQK